MSARLDRPAHCTTSVPLNIPIPHAKGDVAWLLRRELDFNRLIEWQPRARRVIVAALIYRIDSRSIGFVNGAKPHPRSRSNRRLVMASSTTMAFGSRSRSSSSVGGRCQSSTPFVARGGRRDLFDLANEQVNRNIELALKVRGGEASPRSVRPFRWSVLGHIFLRARYARSTPVTHGIVFPALVESCQ